MKNRKIKLISVLLFLCLFPLLVFAVISWVFNSLNFKSELRKSVFSELRVVCESMGSYYNGHDFTNPTSEDYSVINKLKFEGIDLAIFLEDSVVMSSTDVDPVSSSVFTRVKEDGYYTEAGAGKLVCYTQLKDKHDEVIGMVVAYKDEVERSMGANVLILSLLLVAVILISSVSAFVIKRKIMVIREAVLAVSKGDLTEDSTVQSFIAEIDELNNAVISLKSRLRNVVTVTKNSFSGVGASVDSSVSQLSDCDRASEIVSNAVNDLASSNLELANSIQQCNTLVIEIAKNIEDIKTETNKVETNIGVVKDVSLNANTELNNLISANKTTEKVAENVANGIKEASEASERISNAAKLITDIASQTNLLSLNASIEAARAGDAGKSFSVVATNISELAVQSTNCAKEIQDIVKSIIKVSDSNVQLANKIKNALYKEARVLGVVDKSFKDVLDGVDSMVSGIKVITSGTDVLNSSKNNILNEITSISAVSEETAASCENTNASMEELKANINEISDNSLSIRDEIKSVRESFNYFNI